MNIKIIKTILIVLILSFALPVIGAVKKSEGDINADIKVLEERVKQNDEKITLQLNSQKSDIIADIKVMEERILQNDIKTTQQSESQKNELILRITDLEGRINLYIGFAAVLFAILGFLGYATIVKWIKNTIEDKSEEEIKKYLTKEYVEALIKEKGESAFNILLDDLEKKGKERLDKLEKLRKESEDLLTDLKAKNIDVTKPLPESTAKNLEKFAKKLKTKKEDKYSFDDWFFKGLSEYEEKNYNKAVEAFTKAIELGPKNTVTYNNRGLAYGMLKQYEKAIEDTTKAIELDPKNAAAYDIRGIAYGRLEKYEKAIEDATKAIELDPKNAGLYNNRGVTYASLGNYEKAVEDYSKAIDLDPEYVLTYNSRAFAYSKLKDYKRAIEDYNKAIKLDPKLVNAYLNLSEVYIFDGKFKDALDVITKALTLTTEKKEKTVLFYLELIAKKLLNFETTATEAKLDEILKEELALTWSFEEFEEWLKVADIKEEDKKYITKLTELMKKKKIVS